MTTLLGSINDLDKLRQQILAQRDPKRSTLIISGGTCSLARGVVALIDAVRQGLHRAGLEGKVDVRVTGCHGFCEQEPIIVLQPEGLLYASVTAGDADEIIEKSLVKGEPVERLFYRDIDGRVLRKQEDLPFYQRQNRLIFGPNLNIDPRNIDDYFAQGGYAALAKALSKMTPEQVLAEVKESNLRGRGGGGFPTGVKWETTRNAPSDVKYVIVNCDEGDPGAFMDRSLMEGNPHSVLEGLIIGAYAVGSHEGFIYIRQEYPMATDNIFEAIAQAEAHGLLGKNILGSGFDFTVHVHRGAGAFVSGESSALMSAIEGHVGEPRPKYIRTAVSGIWGKPSILNNVETWANVPLIIDKGAAWFKSIGTEGSKGTKIFALVGKVNNTGLVEVPMGATLRQVIFDIGEGILEGKKFKAVQTGGPSGGCIPEKYLDTPIDFDELSKLGSMMGSGGLIVMDEDTCMVDLAKYFTNFLCDESCGQCIPCREGLRQMLAILTRITQGQGQEGDIELLEDLAVVMSDASLCALGQTAANPVLSTIKYFRDEYEAHVKEKKCPAKVCKALFNFYIEPAKCNACGLCLKNCPSNAVHGEKKIVHWIDQAACTKCGVCFEVCPKKVRAVTKKSGEAIPPPPTEPVAVASRK